MDEKLNDPGYLLEQAKRCRALLQSQTDNNMRQMLLGMAKDYEDQADRLLSKKLI